VTACPVNAIGVDPRTQAKIVIESLCVGCHLCTIACPFGTVYTLPDTGKAAKCHLCGGQPACVAACPTSAIEFVELHQIGSWFLPLAETVDSRFRQSRGQELVG
jgi:Fe-S-cluster-containing hydrogenase component 2